MSSYKRKADTDKLKKEIKGLKEQKKVWQDIVQVTKVGNLLKEKSKLLSEIQKMKKETHAGGKESAALTNKKVQQKRVLPSSSRCHPGTSKSLQNKSTKVQSSCSQHSKLKVQMLEENKGTKRKINYEMDTLNINNMECTFGEWITMEGGKIPKLTDYEDEEKQEAQRAKWRMYKRNQRLKDLDEEEDELDEEEDKLEERRMQIRVQKKAIKELGDEKRRFRNEKF